MSQTLVALILAGVIYTEAQYLGVPQEVVTASYYPYRTALETLAPSVSYGGVHLYNNPYYGSYPYYYYPGYYQPGVYNPFRVYQPVVQQVQQAPLAPPVQEVSVLTPEVVPASDVVEVGLDAGIEDEKSPSIVTIKETIDALPEPPRTFGFRGSPVPPIPAGIVQATQPKFVQVPFQNPKLAPGFKQVINSKVSPLLAELQEKSAGIIRA